MQTFLPYPSFAHSVAVLDRARLGKQRLECQQIIAVLITPDAQRGWAAHPATLMWRGHESALALYMALCVREWTERGYQSTISVPYDERTLLKRPELGHPFVPSARDVRLPPWVGDDRLHASHRAALLRKMPEHYGELGWTDEVPDYWWPTREGEKT